jgi:hypothetical protein
MTLHNYIRRRFYDDVAFTEFDRNPNLIPDDILPDIVARSKSHRKHSKPNTLKNSNFFLLKINIFLIFLDRFDAPLSKIIFKK